MQFRESVPVQIDNGDAPASDLKMAIRDECMADPEQVAVESCAAVPVWRVWLRRRGFAVSVLTLVSGMVLAQGLLVLAAPLLTRLYSPADFAILAVFVSIASLVSAVAGGRYEFALMLPEDDHDAGSLAILAALLAGAVSLAVLGVVVVLRPKVIWWWELEGPCWWILWIPLGVLVYTLCSLATMWQSRKKRFGSMARAEVAASLSCVGVQVCTAWLTASGATGLIAGQLAGRGVAFSVLALEMTRDLLAIRGGLGRQRVIAMGRRFWRFPAFSSSSSLAGRATFEVPKLMLGALFAAPVLGFFSLSLRVVAMPSTLVGQAVSNVFFPRIAEYRHDAERSLALIGRACGFLFVMILLPAAILLLWAEPLFAFVFGAEWVTAGFYCRLLVPSLVAQFVVTPILSSMQAFEKQHLVLAWNLTFLTLAVGALLAGWIEESATLAIAAFSVVSMFMYLAYLAMCVYFARTRPQQSSST